MKRIVLTLLVALVATGLFGTTAFAAEKKNEKTIIFKVDMDCQSCVKKIEGNIPYEKGVKDLKVSLENKECTVTFRTDKTTIESLKEAFKKLGYVATEKEETPTETIKKTEEHKH